MKEKLKEIIRSVPITDKTYPEYVEALAERIVEENYRKIADDHARQCTCYALGCQMAEGLKRKVAEEIFAELYKRLDDITILMGALDSFRTFHKTIEKVTAEVDELKKKYIGKDTNVTTNTEVGNADTSH